MQWSKDFEVLRRAILFSKSLLPFLIPASFQLVRRLQAYPRSSVNKVKAKHKRNIPTKSLSFLILYITRNYDLKTVIKVPTFSLSRNSLTFPIFLLFFPDLFSVVHQFQNKNLMYLSLQIKL